MISTPKARANSTASSSRASMVSFSRDAYAALDEELARRRMQPGGRAL
jgi:hypothetical protein